MSVLSLADAEALAERTLTAITALDLRALAWRRRSQAADRERVASDLAGLRWHDGKGGDVRGYHCTDAAPCDDRRRDVENLLRTARLYGQAP